MADACRVVTLEKACQKLSESLNLPFVAISVARGAGYPASPTVGGKGKMECHDIHRAVHKGVLDRRGANALCRCHAYDSVPGNSCTREKL